MSDPLVIAGREFGSRLFLGTARYPNNQLMLDAIAASGTQMVTAAIRRISLAGEDDKLFGSVTNGDVAEALAKEGHKIDKREIILVDPLKALGIHEVRIHLAHEVQAVVKVWVVKQEAAS